MTNQDAIDILKHMLENLSIEVSPLARGSDSSDAEALRMAISALTCREVVSGRYPWERYEPLHH